MQVTHVFSSSALLFFLQGAKGNRGFPGSMGEAGIKVTSSLQPFPTGWVLPTFPRIRDCNHRLYQNKPMLSWSEFFESVFWGFLPSYSKSHQYYWVFPAPGWMLLRYSYLIDQSHAWEMGPHPIPQMRKLSSVEASHKAGICGLSYLPHHSGTVVTFPGRGLQALTHCGSQTPSGLSF